jgi:hypothetical protein
MRHDGNVTAARQLVESYLDGRGQDTVEAVPLPTHPDEPTYSGIDGDGVPTPAQGVAALVALRDAYCPGVEKIIYIPAELPAVGDASPPDHEALNCARKRALTWSATLERVRNLGDHALPWFELQLRRFERALSESARNTPPPANDLTGQPADATARPVQTAAGEGENQLPDGPFEIDGFRFRGIEVRFGRAALQQRLALALWDAENQRPSLPRPVEDVMSEVYGQDHATEDNTFRQLCSDTRRRFEAANLSLTLENLQGMLGLVPQPA